MPTSPSPKRGTKPPTGMRRPRLLLPAVVIILLAALSVMVIALPASLVTRFLPPVISADDFSGSVWHGSAGRIVVNGRDAGAVEWRLHPRSLLRLAVSADLHWVKIGFVADGAADLDTRGFA